MKPISKQPFALGYELEGEINPIQLVPFEIWIKIHGLLINETLNTFTYAGNDDFVDSVKYHASASKANLRDGKSFAQVCKFFNQAAKKNNNIQAQNERNVEQQAEMALGLMKNS